MFANCLVLVMFGRFEVHFSPKSHVRTCSKFGFDDFEKNWARFLLTKFVNSSMFKRFKVRFWAEMRCSNVFEVQSSKVQDVPSSVF